MRKIVLSIIILSLYLAIPLFAAIPGAAPGLFDRVVAGAPLSIWFVVALFVVFPAIACLWASPFGADRDGE